MAFSGLGRMGIKGAQAIRRAAAGSIGSIAREVATFDAGVDDVWLHAKNRYAMIAVRDAKTLNRIYPGDDRRFKRIEVLRRNQTIGWAVLMNSQKDAHSHFGAMRFASVVDCLAIPGEEARVVAAATHYLEGGRADLIVTNQLSEEWGAAFRRNGYFQGPSNFLLAVAPQLADRLQPFETTASRIHMTRGDGDGPTNL
jgi:hypothetical protein